MNALLSMMAIYRIAALLVVAGGLAFGRGADGESELPPDTLKVSCPSEDARLDFWCSRVVRKLETEWSSQPQVETYKPDTLALSFTATRDGSLSNFRIESHSSDTAFRNKASRISDGSFHLPPIPANYGADEIALSVVIRKGISKDSSMERRREVSLARILHGLEVIHDEDQNTSAKRKIVASILKDTLVLLAKAAGADEPTTELQKKNFKNTPAYAKYLPKIDSIIGSVLGARYAMKIHTGKERASINSIVDQVFSPEGKSVVNPFGWGEETRGDVRLSEYDLNNRCLRVAFVGSLLIDEYLVEPRIFELYGKKRTTARGGASIASKIKCGPADQDCLDGRATVLALEKMAKEEQEAADPVHACIEMDEKTAAGLENNDEVDLYLAFRIKPKLLQIGERLILQSTENQLLVSSEQLTYQPFAFKLKPKGPTKK